LYGKLVYCYVVNPLLKSELCIGSKEVDKMLSGLFKLNYTFKNFVIA